MNKSRLHHTLPTCAGLINSTWMIKGQGLLVGPPVVGGPPLLHWCPSLRGLLGLKHIWKGQQSKHNVVSLLISRPIGFDSYTNTVVSHPLLKCVYTTRNEVALVTQGVCISISGGVSIGSDFGRTFTVILASH